MNTEDMRILLIKSTIHTISNVGIDRATTKLLAGNANLNEVYIYRIFGGKDQLFEAAFTYIDKQFSSHLVQYFEEGVRLNAPMKESLYNFFSKIWEFALTDKERCSYFIRYYYSRYYSKSCSANRKALYEDIINMSSGLFKDGTNIWWLFNYMLDIVFSSAVKVLREEIPENEQTKENIFLLLYAAFKQHFK